MAPRWSPALLLAVCGAVIGALLGMAAHALTGALRDFASIGGLRADSYEVLVHDNHAEHVAQLLAVPGNPARS
ncbi:hypothetical protein [Actinoplanes subtropicus]|uniref:hypothetical protein n=1 Tax=Actinoplanes subtropicus TaxID=543632 RepID=UPI001B80A3AE|nr:hypothetical protein [Actinoplanes subtropicus]